MKRRRRSPASSTSARASPSAKGSYDDANVPYIDYNLTIAGTQKPKRNQNQFLGDPSAGGFVNVGIVNIIRGDPATQKPARPTIAVTTI